MQITWKCRSEILNIPLFLKINNRQIIECCFLVAGPHRNSIVTMRISRIQQKTFDFYDFKVIQIIQINQISQIIKVIKSAVSPLGLLLKNVEEAHKLAEEHGLVPNQSTPPPTHPHPQEFLSDVNKNHSARVKMKSQIWTILIGDLVISNHFIIFSIQFLHFIFKRHFMQF